MEIIYNRRNKSEKIYPSQLKLARKSRGFNQRKLCGQIDGLSQSNLSKFENGKIYAISNDKLRIIMDFLNYPYSFLTIEIKKTKGFICSINY